MSEENSAITVGYPYTPYRLTDNPSTGEARFSGCGIWIDRTGLYSVGQGSTQVEIDSEDGKFYAGQGSIVLDEEGLSVTQLRDALAFYTEGEIIGDLSSSMRAGETFISLRKISTEGSSDNLINGDFEDGTHGTLPNGWNRVIPDTTYGGISDEWETHAFWPRTGDYCFAAAIYCNNLSNYMSYEAISDPIYFEPDTSFSTEGYISLVDWNYYLRNGYVSGSIVASLKFYDNSDNLLQETEIGTQNTNDYIRISDNDIVSPSGSEYLVYSLTLYGIKEPEADWRNPQIGATVDDLKLYFISGSSGGFISSSIEIFDEQINYNSSDHNFNGDIIFSGDSGINSKIYSDIYLGRSDYGFKKYDVDGEAEAEGYLYVPLNPVIDWPADPNQFSTLCGDGATSLLTGYNYGIDFENIKAITVRFAVKWISANVNQYACLSVDSSAGNYAGVVRANSAGYYEEGQFIVPTIPTINGGQFYVYVNGASNIQSGHVIITGYYI
jgi:hypothetical protein